jgi:pantothenate kinase
MVGGALCLISSLFVLGFPYPRQKKLQEVTMSLVKPDDAMEPMYEQLARELSAKANHFDGTAISQWWVGIAGGPGSGKSTLASAICEKLNLANEDTAVVIPMDGYHYSRAELRTMGAATEGPSYEELLARRGSPWTFNSAALCKKMSEGKRMGTAKFPVYSREKSDPVDDPGVELSSENRIVLCEGNYLLSFDDPDWAPLASLFDEKWFICCDDIRGQRDRLINRHLKTWTEEKTRMWGVGYDGAAAKADANDMLNLQFINDGSKKHADRVIKSI